MDGFVKIARKDDLLSSRGLSVRVDGADIAIFKVGDTVFAVQNDCPHQHFSLLHQGELKEFALTCPMHGWTFDLRTGKSIIGGGNLKQYKVKIVADEVWLERPAE